LKEFLKNSAAQLADTTQLNDTVLVCFKCGKSRFGLGSLAPRRGGRFDCSYLPVHSLDHSCSTPQTRSQEELKAAAAAVWAERAAALLPLPVKGAEADADAAHAHAPPADAPLAAAPAGVPGAPGGGRKAPRKPATWKPAQPLVSDLDNWLADERASAACALTSTDAGGAEALEGAVPPPAKPKPKPRRKKGDPSKPRFSWTNSKLDEAVDWLLNHNPMSLVHMNGDAIIAGLSGSDKAGAAAAGAPQANHAATILANSRKAIGCGQPRGTGRARACLADHSFVDDTYVLRTLLIHSHAGAFCSLSFT
jgi:hypothetical protein